MIMIIDDDGDGDDAKNARRLLSVTVYNFYFFCLFARLLSYLFSWVGSMSLIGWLASGLCAECSFTTKT